jgi:hypothetical protein
MAFEVVRFEGWGWWRVRLGCKVLAGTCGVAIRVGIVGGGGLGNSHVVGLCHHGGRKSRGNSRM